MRLIALIGVEGKHVNIAPKAVGHNLTELYSKAGSGIDEYMGVIMFDPSWNKYVLAELHPNFQMSLDCIKEAFEMTENYWSRYTKTPKQIIKEAFD